MTTQLRHWRDAATVILAAKSAPSISKTVLPPHLASAAAKYDYRVLMLKRSGQSKFMPNTHVFPGGVVHDSDYSETWLKCAPIKRRNVKMQVSSIPPIFDKDTPSSVLPHIALGICAVRETFEEAGILLCLDHNGRSVTKGSLNSPDVKSWRYKVNSDASQFLCMCQELNIVPDLDGIKLWSDWLTPNHIRKLAPTSGRRFDTLFYFYGISEEPEALHDNQETTDSQWSTPVEILYHHRVGNHWIAPPQQYEFCRLAHFKRFLDLCEFAQQREQHGAQRWLPVRTTCTDGTVSLLPGDCLYPEDVDLYGEREMPEIKQPIEQTRSHDSSLNRVEIFGPHNIIVRSNTADPCGHRTPLCEDIIFEDVVQAELG